MIILQNCKFAQNESSSYVSGTFFNAAGDILTVQIDGGKGKYYIEGRTNSNMEWISLAAINLQNFAIAAGVITNPGIYEVGISGIRELRARIEEANEVTTISGQIISTEEA